MIHSWTPDTGATRSAPPAPPANAWIWVPAPTRTLFSCHINVTGAVHTARHPVRGILVEVCHAVAGARAVGIAERGFALGSARHCRGPKRGDEVLGPHCIPREAG